MDDLKVTLANLFPITVRHYDGNSYAISQLFRRHKPENMSWYEVDMIIHSETDVTFEVYDMDCPVYGGRGRLQGTLDAKVKPEDVAQWISTKIDRMAKDREAHEFHMARQARVKEIAKSYRTQLRRQLRAARKQDESENKAVTA